MKQVLFLRMLIVCLSSWWIVGCGASRVAAQERAFEEGLYRRIVDCIVNDSLASAVCDLPTPVPVRVLDSTICSPFSIGRSIDLIELFYHTDRSDDLYYHDSLDTANYQPCSPGFVPFLSTLSTIEGGPRFIALCQIDSTYAPGHYVVPAYVFHQYEMMSGEVGREMSPEEKRRGRVVALERDVSYLFVFDREGRMTQIFSSAGEGRVVAGGDPNF